MVILVVFGAKEGSAVMLHILNTFLALITSLSLFLNLFRLFLVFLVAFFGNICIF